MEMKIEPLALPGVDTQRPIVIAGPCSAETEEQVLETAQGLASRGVKIFRAGIWKPRTKPGGFEGIGAEGLAWLKKVKKETGMLVSTEVATKDHVFEALKAGIDILWIGARTTVNPFAVQEIADALKEQYGLEISKAKLVQEEPIKSFGTYELKCKLGYEVTGTVKVTVAEE